MVNRSAIVVRVKQPFWDWMSNLPDPIESDITLEDINRDPHVYLLPEYEDDKEQQEILAEFSNDIFEVMLEGWWLDSADWPDDRSLNNLNKWFDVQCHSCVVDLDEIPLLDDE